MNHLPLPAMITLAEKGKLNRKFAKLKHRLPVCMSCMFGTAHRKPWRSKGEKGSIRKPTDNVPGKCVSIDQMISAQPGLIPQMAGFLTNLRIWGATIFVDHYSDYVFVALMRDLTLEETLLAKASFERHANEGGVTINSYRADNGRFADSGFQQAVKDCNQKITYCAVGVHHQNGIVERRIKELTLISRTLLLHAKRHWPDYITTMMWPFALKEAAYRLNRLSLRSDGRSCEATFFDVDTDFIDPSIYHSFGSPCFVLDSRLQSGVGGAPKWEPRSHLGIYVGHSPSHAGSVALVLNPRTGHVSPQFHVVFDDHFTTVPFMEKNEVPPHWAKLIENSREKVTEEHYELAKTWLFPDPELGDISMPERNQKVSNNPNENCETTDHNFSQNSPSTEIQPPIQVGFSISDASNNTQRPLLPLVSSSRNGEMTPSKGQDSLSAPRLINLETSGLRRSSRIAALNGVTNDDPAIAAYTSSTTQLKSSRRITRPKPHLSFLSVFNSVGARWNFATSNPHSEYEHLSFVARIANDFEQINGLFDDTLNAICHQIQAYTTSNESFTYSQMLRETDHTKFFEAMEIEINDHEGHRHWDLMLRTDLPLGSKTIMAIWSFKRKRFPNGTLNKHKARLCAHGGQQTWGQDYWDTYACCKPSDQPRDAARREECSNWMKRV